MLAALGCGVVGLISGRGGFNVKVGIPGLIEAGRSIESAANQVNEGLTNHGQGIARAGEGVGQGLTNHGENL